MSLVPVEVEFTFRSVAAQGGTLTIEGAARVRIAGDDASIRAAAERFLSKPREEIAAAARMTIERSVRAAAESAPAGAILGGREAFSRKAQVVAAHDLSPMGLAIESLVLRNAGSACG